MDNQESADYAVAMASRKKKRSWGGRRPGAGRKSVLKNPVPFNGILERTDVEILEAIAEERGVSVASVVRDAVAVYVKRSRR